MALKHWKNLSGKKHVVGCVLNTKDFYPTTMPKNDLRMLWGLNTSGKIYLNTSLDEPRKNIETFFMLAKEYPDDLFIRVGQFSKWMKKFIKTYSISNVTHYFRLPLDKLRELYQLSDVFLYPSLLEGFGIPPFESMACGTPVISSGTSALKENLEGFCPLIKNPKSIDEWKIVLDSKLPTQAATLKNSRKLLDLFSPKSFEKKLKIHLQDLGF
jgi:glycosyltransferase involved in cell wall biosynthesis